MVEFLRSLGNLLILSVTLLGFISLLLKIIDAIILLIILFDYSFGLMIVMGSGRSFILGPDSWQERFYDYISYYDSYCYFNPL